MDATNKQLNSLLTVVAYTLRRNAGLSPGCWVSLPQMWLVICSAWSSDPALVTRLQMTERTHSRSAEAELKAQANNISELGERRMVPLSTTSDGEVRSTSAEASMREAMSS